MLEPLRRHPEFRRLWTAQVISQLGDWLNRIAILTLIARLGGTDAAQAVGLLYGVELALRLLPYAAFSPLAGSVADRLPRRAVMVLADVGRAAVVLGFLVIDEPHELPVLYVLLGLQTGIGVFFDSARSASLPNTVPREDLHAAYALSAATWSLMLAVGAAAGGYLMMFVGLRGVFLVDALTYLVSGVILLRLKLPPVPRQEQPFRWASVVKFQEFRRGLHHARERGVARILSAKTFWGAGGGLLVLLSILGQERFGDAELSVGETGRAFGLLFCARGVGTGVGPILMRRLAGSTDRALYWQVVSGFALAGIGYLLLAGTLSLPMAMLWIAIAHMGGSSIWVASTTYWQKHVQDAYRGRVVSLEYFGHTVSFAAGGILAGCCYDWFGDLDRTVVYNALLVLVLGSVWALFGRRTEQARDSHSQPT